MERQQDVIRIGLGTFNKEKFKALIFVRATALTALRQALAGHGYIEVTTATLVNIAGSCENPQASFTLNFYGREAHLSQSAQLQLEALVLRLKQPVFTVNNSFREEHFDDPDTAGRRLSEFTLIEPERPFEGFTPEQALATIIKEMEDVIKFGTNAVVNTYPEAIRLLGGDITFLKTVVSSPFNRITYDEALELLHTKGFNHVFGDDLGIKEERVLLQHFNNIPTFVTHFPAAIKFFNMKKMSDGKRVFSVDLLMPKLGETTGGAVREEDGEKIKESLNESKVGSFLNKKGIPPEVSFREYFNLFTQEKPLVRGGFGIGFERFVAFLLGSNDILETISYRTMQPR